MSEHEITLADVRLKFTSGNEVTVERATVLTKEWAVVETSIAALEAERTQLVKRVAGLSADHIAQAAALATERSWRNERDSAMDALRQRNTDLEALGKSIGESFQVSENLLYDANALIGDLRFAIGLLHSREPGHEHGCVYCKLMDRTPTQAGEQLRALEAFVVKVEEEDVKFIAPKYLNEAEELVKKYRLGTYAVVDTEARKLLEVKDGS